MYREWGINLDKLKIKLKKVDQSEAGAKDLYGEIPGYATPGAAAVDLRACLKEKVVLKANGRVKIPTGIAIQLPGPEVVALVFARSGLAAKYGINLTNGVGVIDSDYRGEIQVLLSNYGAEDFTINHGDRIAQMAFMPVRLAQFTATDELDDTDRGTGGFGSTGI